MQERSDDDLAEARSNIVGEIQRLHDEVRVNRNRQERRRLERQLDFKYQELRTIDAEFNRRGLEPRNASSSN